MIRQVSWKCYEFTSVHSRNIENILYIRLEGLLRKPSLSKKMLMIFYFSDFVRVVFVWLTKYFIHEKNIYDLLLFMILYKIRVVFERLTLLTKYFIHEHCSLTDAGPRTGSEPELRITWHWEWVRGARLVWLVPNLVSIDIITSALADYPFQIKMIILCSRRMLCVIC